MTHINFDPNSVNWSAYLESQEGGGRYFEGTRYQRGYGFLQNIGKLLLPVVKNFAMSAGEEGMAAGAKVLKDISDGKDLKDSLKSHASTGLGNLAGKVQQCGKGRRKKRRVIDQFSV